MNKNIKRIFLTFILILPANPSLGMEEKTMLPVKSQIPYYKVALKLFSQISDLLESAINATPIESKSNNPLVWDKEERHKTRKINEARDLIDSLRKNKRKNKRKYVNESISKLTSSVSECIAFIKKNNPDTKELDKILQSLGEIALIERDVQVETGNKLEEEIGPWVKKIIRDLEKEIDSSSINKENVENCKKFTKIGSSFLNLIPLEPEQTELKKARKKAEKSLFPIAQEAKKEISTSHQFNRSFAPALGSLLDLANLQFKTNSEEIKPNDRQKAAIIIGKAMMIKHQFKGDMINQINSIKDLGVNIDTETCEYIYPKGFEAKKNDS